MIYASGHLELLQQSSVAMVGSRRPTPQGEETAKDFARTLSQQGLTIVSGLAQGIDGISQTAALEGAGSTIAVLGAGIDRVYPASHHHLAHNIAEHGLLLSDYPLGTQPIASNFPKRNRIIAGLSLGTLVVEATLRSGSLIAARLATETGREVFAIPGSIHNPQAKGCHWLIRRGAKLVETAQDVLEELNYSPAQISTTPVRLADTQTAKEQENSLAENPPQTTVPSQTSGSPDEADEDPILAAIGQGPTSFEAIINLTGMDTPTLQARLLMLELSRQIARLPGNMFQRLYL